MGQIYLYHWYKYLCHYSALFKLYLAMVRF